MPELAHLVRERQQQGSTVVHCHGVFDLVHPGHIRHLQAAREAGDVLIVTVTKDEFVNKGPGRPVFNQQLRLESVAALECVDYVAINDGATAGETIRTLKPNVYVKGSEYRDARNDVTGAISAEEEAITSVGGRLHFTDGITFSSTELLNSQLGVYPPDAREFLERFRMRYSADAIIAYLHEIRGLKVLVLGDTIIDEYCYCHALGISPKETIVSAGYLREETFAGGILACANHMAGFCDDVHLLTSLGAQDSREDFVRQHLKPNVQATLLSRPDSRTIVKRRYLEPAFMSRMFEICVLGDGGSSGAVEEATCRFLDDRVSDFDLVVVGDYGHGFFSSRIIELLCRRATFLAVCAQTNSANIGFNLITKYPHADYVCIDEPEIRLALHDRSAPLEQLVTDVAQALNSDRIAVTRGHRGCVTFAKDTGLSDTPVFSTEIVDRIGAGDAFLSITAPCAAKRYPMDAIGFIGNAVGAIAVRVVCNRSSVEPVPLFKFITALLK